MQDRSPPARRNHLQRAAGPYIWVKADLANRLSEFRFTLLADNARHGQRGSKAIRMEDAMSMSVESILRQKGADVATIAPEASVKRATSWLHAKNVGSLVVTSGNAVVGLISEREIVHAIA